jgi:LacI family transcriptional regulator
VDRALHNRGRIGEATKRRILTTAARHGYMPNPAARELMTGTSTIVGAVIPAINSLFFMDLMEGVRKALGRVGLHLMLSPAANGEEAVALVREYASRRARAVLIVPPESNTAIPPALTRQVRVVSLVNPCARTSTVFVAPDERGAGRTGVAYLRSRGHRRILYLSYRRRSWAMREREEGYRAAMGRARVKPRMLIGVAEDRLMRAVESYRPTALFCHNDWLALSAIRLLSKHGLRVPEDLSVLGIDNSPSFVALFPETTTLEYPVNSVAARVVKTLEGKEKGGARGRFKVVERQTVRRV